MAVVAFDIDGVLADFNSAFISICNKQFGYPALDAKPTDWHWSNLITKKEINAVWKEIHETENFWDSLEPLADHMLLKRVWIKNNVIFPTARAQCRGLSTTIQSQQWLHYTYGILFPNVIVSDEKGPLASVLKYDYFIDDKPQNCLDVKAAAPNCRVYLCDASHNQDFSHSEITRVKDANEFCNIILEENEREKKQKAIVKSVTGWNI